MAADAATAMAKTNAVEDKMAEMRRLNEQRRRRFAEEEADRNEAMAKGMSVTAEQSRIVRTTVEADVRSRLQPRGKPSTEEDYGEPEADDSVDFEYDDYRVPSRHKAVNDKAHYDKDSTAQSQRRVQVRSGGPNRYPNLVVSVLHKDDEKSNYSDDRGINGPRRGKQPQTNLPNRTVIATPPSAQRSVASQQKQQSTDRPSVHDRLGWNPRAGPNRGSPKTNFSVRAYFDEEPSTDYARHNRDDRRDLDDYEPDYERDMHSTGRRGGDHRYGEVPSRRGEPANRRGGARPTGDRRRRDEEQDRDRDRDADVRGYSHERRFDSSRADESESSFFDRYPPSRDGGRPAPGAGLRTRGGVSANDHSASSARGRNAAHGFARNRPDTEDAAGNKYGNAKQPPARTKSQEDDPYRLDERDFANYFHRIVENVKSKRQPGDPDDGDDVNSGFNDESAYTRAPMQQSRNDVAGATVMMAAGQPHPGSLYSQARPNNFPDPQHQHAAMHSAGANVALAVAESVIQATFGDFANFADTDTSPTDMPPSYFERQASNASAAYDRQLSGQGYDASKQPRMLRGRGVNPATAAAMLDASNVSWYQEVEREQEERLAESSDEYVATQGNFQPAARHFSENAPVTLVPVPVPAPYQNATMTHLRYMQPEQADYNQAVVLQGRYQSAGGQPQPQFQNPHMGNYPIDASSAAAAAAIRLQQAPMQVQAPALAQFDYSHPQFPMDPNNYAGQWSAIQPQVQYQHSQPPQPQPQPQPQPVIDRFVPPNARPMSRGGAHSYNTHGQQGANTGGFRQNQKAPQRYRGGGVGGGNLPDFSAIERANSELDQRGRSNRGAFRGDRRHADRGGGRRRPAEKRGDDEDFEDVEEQVIVGDVGDEDAS